MLTPYASIPDITAEMTESRNLRTNGRLAEAKAHVGWTRTLQYAVGVRII
jgi:hypothetical protein